MNTTIPTKLASLLSRLRERGDVRRAGKEWRTRCPAHDDNGPSLYVALSGDRTRALLSCKAGCEVADIVAALDLDLDALFLDGDPEVGVDDLYRVVDESPAPEGRRAGPGPSSPEPAEQANTDLDLRHQVYGDLLARLTLAAPHRQDLLRRGLDDNAIDRLGYRSADRFAVAQAIGRLKKDYDDETLLRVPGFRVRREGVRFVDVEGLLVPVRDPGGRIAALKVRRDPNRDGVKYLYVSSADAGGPSPGSPAHTPLGTPRQADEVRLTEGEIKSDVAFHVSGLPTLGAPGVTNWRRCLEQLRAMQARVVRLAFDQDTPPRPGVVQELRACAEGLLQLGYEVRLEIWDGAGGQYKGIDDLLAAGRQPEVVAGQRVFAALAGVADAAGGEDDEWVPEDPSEEVEPFPLDVFPEPLRQFAAEAAASVQCPPDFIGVPMLAVAGGAIGASRALRIRDGFEEGPRIYAAIVARPGAAKSPALRLVCAPVYAEQSRLREKLRRDKDTYENAKEAYENARKAPPREVDAADPPPGKPLEPSMPHLYVGDITAEAMAQRLEQNPRGLMMIRDELTSWVGGMNQYRGGRGADRQVYLSCWSGEPAKVDRKSDKGEPILVTDPFLCVIGCIPPGKLRDLDAENECEDGFVHRVLFAFPRAVRNRRWTWSGLPPDTRDRWKEALGKLYALQMGEGDAGRPVARTVRFTEEARALWEGWCNALYEEIETPDFPEVLVGPWSKMVGYAARLALVLQMLRLVCGEANGEDVDAESLDRAFRLIAYFQSHARVVYFALHHSSASRRVQRVIAWVRSHGGECSPTHLVKNNVAGIARKTEALKVMKELVDHGYGRLEERRARNNRMVTWFIGRAASRVQSVSVG